MAESFATRAILFFDIPPTEVKEPDMITFPSACNAALLTSAFALGLNPSSRLCRPRSALRFCFASCPQWS